MQTLYGDWDLSCISILEAGLSAAFSVSMQELKTRLVVDESLLFSFSCFLGSQLVSEASAEQVSILVVISILFKSWLVIRSPSSTEITWPCYLNLSLRERSRYPGTAIVIGVEIFL